MWFACSPSIYPGWKALKTWYRDIPSNTLFLNLALFCWLRKFLITLRLRSVSYAFKPDSAFLRVAVMLSFRFLITLPISSVWVWYCEFWRSEIWLSLSRFCSSRKALNLPSCYAAARVRKAGVNVELAPVASTGSRDQFLCWPKIFWCMLVPNTESPPNSSRPDAIWLSWYWLLRFLLEYLW